MSYCDCLNCIYHKDCNACVERMQKVKDGEIIDCYESLDENENNINGTKEEN